MMKSPTIPLICGAALAVMIAASASHWWSVRNFVAAVDHGLPVSADAGPMASAPVTEKPATPVATPVEQTPTQPLKAAPPAAKVADAKLAAAPAKTRPAVESPAKGTVIGADGSQKEFYEALIGKLKTLENQNQDLRDQMAETNRDMLKMQFQIDTHSESFRPMPVSEERQDTSLGSGPGVLPPRAEPVIDFPFEEN